MTDRFPLIINSEDQQIQELSSGDNLDLTGSGIVADVFTVDTNSQERLRIDSSGRLGIGTTEPSSNIGSTPVLDISGTYGGLALSSSVPSANKVEIGNFGYNTMVFATDSVERMRIDSSGRMGLGTSSVDELLHLQGASADDTTLKIESTATAAERSAIEFFNGSISRGRVSGSNDFDGLTLDSSTTESAAVIRFRTGGASLTERMRIDSSGRLLVGTSSNYAQQNADDLVIGNNQSSARVGITLGSTIESGIRFADSANNSAGIIEYFHTDNSLRIATNATEQIRIDSSGRLGVGTTAPVRALQIGQHGTGAGEMALAASTTGNCSILMGDGATGSDFYRGYIQYQNVNDSLVLATSALERMRLDSSGNILIGSSSQIGTGGKFQITSSADTAIFRTTSTTTYAAVVVNVQNTAARLLAFQAGNTTNVGTITTNGSSTSYNTSSDHRLKENVVNIADGITRVKQLQPKRFNFIADADTTVDGFLAHEAQTVVPEAVSGSKDEVDDKGNPVYQGIDQSKLVPLLTAALQEALAKIETLEQRLSDAGIA